MSRLPKTARSRLWAAVVAAAAFGLVLLVWNDSMRLRLQYELQSSLVRNSKVADLDIEAVRGLKMFLHPDDSVITARIMADRIWEPTETHWVVRMLREGDTFIDVGANVGYYTLIASRLVGPTGHVVAFEPDPVAFRIMKRNVQLNGLENVTLERKALSNESGVIQLFLADANKGDHRIFQTDEEQRPSIDVDAVTLDDYLGADVASVDFVKIDTQGAEGLILEGMQRILASNPELVIALEYWPYALAELEFEARDVLEHLRAHDFLFLDLGMGGRELRTRLQDVDESFLLEKFPVAPPPFGFTNLLLVKGHAELQRLERNLALRERDLGKDTAELRAARMKWEMASRAALTRGVPLNDELPDDIAAALREVPERRDEDEEGWVAAYFRSTTPLLARERAELGRAHRAVEEFRDHVQSSRRIPD